ncbi:hypothetical protein DBP19_33775 [Streptomyces sp. CS090A]|nr:hypothetical protein DBP19_33775 [Streptomyces sp. CS090A]
MIMNLHGDAIPEGLSRRARSFVASHGVRADVTPLEPYRERWLALGIPGEVVDRAVAYQERWGGLVLPPAPVYECGPRYLYADVPEPAHGGGWWFTGGEPRAAVAFSFMVGPNGEFGLWGDVWAPLYASVEGWVESLALTHHASRWAKQVTRLHGDEAEALSLDGFEPVEEVQGIVDTWWRGPDSLVALHNGEAECYTGRARRVALVYAGLDEWGLHGQ